MNQRSSGSRCAPLGSGARATLAVLIALALGADARGADESKPGPEAVDVVQIKAHLANRLKEAAARLGRRLTAKDLVKGGLEPGRDAVARAERLGAVPPGIGTADAIRPEVAKQLGSTRDPALEWALRADLTAALRRPPAKSQLDKIVKQRDVAIATLNARLREHRGEVQAAYAKDGRLPRDLLAALVRPHAEAGTAPSEHDGGGAGPGESDPEVETSLFLQMFGAAARGQ